MWGQLEGFEERGQKQREVVESVLEEGAKQHTVDAKHIKIHVSFVAYEREKQTVKINIQSRIVLEVGPL